MMFELLKPPFAFNDFKLPETDGVWMIESSNLFTTSDVTYVSRCNFKKIHNSFGPAFITIETHGAQVIYVSYKWYIDGNLHRLDGPAVQTYNVDFDDGQLMYNEDFYLFNKFFYFKRDYEAALIKHMLGIDSEALKIIKSLI